MSHDERAWRRPRRHTPRPTAPGIPAGRPRGGAAARRRRELLRRPVSPDGLEKVAADHGLDANATDSHTAGSPLAGYEVRGVADGRLSVGAAGAVGVGATFVLAGGLFLLVRRRRRRAHRQRRDRPDVGLSDGGCASPRGTGALYLHGHSAESTGCPPHVKIATLVVFLLAGRLDTRARQCGRSALYARAARGRGGQGPGRRSDHRSPGWRSRSRSCSSPCSCRSSRQARRVEVARPVPVRSPVSSAPGTILAKGTARSHRVASCSRRPPRPADLLLGLQRLRLPELLVTIASFMLRYVDVVSDEMRRMRIARASRGFDAGGPRSLAGASRRPAGALFIRSYERGERVHLAMLVAWLLRADAGADDAVTRRPRAMARGDGAAGRGGCVLALAVDGGAVSAPPSLEVRGLAYAYPDGHQALFGVDLDGRRAASGSPCSGPNGAGKTTLVLHLNGILTAGAGHGTVAGLGAVGTDREHLRRDPPPGRHRLPGPGRPAVHADGARGRGVRPANLGLRGAELDAPGARGAGRRSAWPSIADRPPHHLSFGQRRRVAVATVLAMRPGGPGAGRAVVSNLDPAARRELADILRASTSPC